MARVHLSAAKKVALWKMIYQGSFFIILFVRYARPAPGGAGGASGRFS